MKRSLSRQLAALSLLLAVVLLSSWALWCFYDTQQTLLDQKEQDIQLLLNRTCDYVQLYAQGLSTNLLSLSAALEVIEEDEGQIQAALTGFQSSNPGKVLSVACLTEDGRAWCNRATALEVFGNAHFTEFYTQAVSSSYQGLRWSEPYVSPLTLERTVALFKPIRLGGKQAAVIMEVNLGTMLSSILRATNDSSLTWAVVSGGGQLVATSDDFTTISSNYKQIPRATLEGQLDALTSLSMGAQRCTIAGADYLFFRRAAMCMDWTLMAFARQATLRQTVQPLLMRTLGMGALHLALLTLLLALAAGRFTRPIVRLAAKIQRADSPLELSFPEAVGRQDEVGVLARSLSGMIDRIRRLNARQAEILQEQRRLELDVLQGQIHPHFLGNTLACIQSLVKDGRRDASLSALTALVRLLNYSIARTDATATLRDELNCAQAYVALRRMRAAYPFDYQVYVSPAHLHHPVPRLILQPIIENAIVHGFAGLNRPGAIVITSYVQEGRLFLCVDDDGLGATDRRLAAVMAGTVPPSAHAHGIGVQNVFRRLQLQDSGHNGCRIQSKPEGGVRVLLDLGMFHPEPLPDVPAHKESPT